MATLSPILYVTPWTRIVLVRGMRNVGRLSDDRTNPVLHVARTLGAARWRSNNGAFAIVCWAADKEPGALTLVYNYEGHSVATLAALLLEAYDEKLQRLRSLPTLWWFDLQPDEEFALEALERHEFQLGDPQHQLLPAGVHQPYANYEQLIDEQALVMAHYCAGRLCFAPATLRCERCQRQFCADGSCVDEHACQ